MSPGLRPLLALLAMGALAVPSWAQAPPADLTELSLSDLMSIRVSSASRRDEDLLHVSSAVHVISQEDIRRSGASSLMDVLRMVPGMDVARINGAEWSISARGFTGYGANKLLVLVDGRSIYTPLFGGVLWQAEDMPLWDIERIEVIRGPGATLWGSNAVNGVINIITKKAGDTQGTLVDAGIGTQDSHRLGVRFGGHIGENASFRVFGANTSHESFELPDGSDGHDDAHSTIAGVRFDIAVGNDDLMVTANARGSANGHLARRPILQPPFTVVAKGTETWGTDDVLARWTHHGAKGVETSVQASYENFRLTTDGFHADVDMSDIEMQQRRRLGSSQVLTWGLGARASSASTSPGAAIQVQPAAGTDHLLSAYIQHEVDLARGRVHLTLGSKFEQNDYTGLEVQPSVRASWSVRPRHVIWSALSRAARIPTFADAGLRLDLRALPIDGSPPGLVRLFGNPRLDAEHVDTFEIGYRAELTPHVTLDVSTFSSRYRGLVTTEQGTPSFEMGPGAPHILLPLVFRNRGEGRSRGADVAVSVQATQSWRIAASCSWLDVDLATTKGSTDAAFVASSGASPRWQAQVRSYLDLPKHFELDTTIAYVGARPGNDTPSHLRADLRLGWRPSEKLEISLAVQDFLQSSHVEFNIADVMVASELEPSIHLGATWRF
jgi:iron complex outermembrane receptor protein